MFKKDLPKFTFKATKLRHTLIDDAFNNDGVTIEIHAPNFSMAHQAVEDYFYKSYLRAESIKCEKIEL